MNDERAFGQAERTALLLIAVVGAVGLNGVFLYAVFARRDLLERALGDPIAWALMAEALVVTGLLGWLFTRWQRNRLGWVWFVLLSLAGGLAFSIPAMLLASERRRWRDPTARG